MNQAITTTDNDMLADEAWLTEILPAGFEIHGSDDEDYDGKTLGFEGADEAGHLCVDWDIGMLQLTRGDVRAILKAMRYETK